VSSARWITTSRLVPFVIGWAYDFKRKQIRGIEDAKTLRRGSGTRQTDRHDPQRPGGSAVSHLTQCPSACLGFEVACFTDLKQG